MRISRQNREYRRHVRIYELLRLVVPHIFHALYGLEVEKLPKQDGPILAVCNHNSDHDPIFLGSAVEQHMYFVASDHIFRKGFVSKVLLYLLAPIARIKGSTDAGAALGILRCIKSGASVALFAEGNRSFSGRTGPIFPATGKMARVSGASLVTFRIEGGYLCTPRWAFSRRRGPIKIHPVNIYSPETLKAMSPEEINEAIRKDLYEDAFMRQKTAPKMALYKGKALAEGMEAALFLCPKCKKIGELRSEKDRFFCSCGLSLRYGEDGFFHKQTGTDFESLGQWNDFQLEAIPSYIEASPEGEAFFRDGDAELYELDAEGDMKLLARGDLALYKERLELGAETIPLCEIADMSMVARTGIVFTRNNAHYRIICRERSFSGRKYLLFYDALKGRPFSL